MFNCVLCKDVFDDKETLQAHFRKHGDPNFNMSQKNRHADKTRGALNFVHQDGMVDCDVCDEQFSTISKAITHKHKAHPDHESKYFCPWCGKLFTLKHLYNKHLQTNHDESDTTDNFHCDPCNVDFHIPSAMIYHNKHFHRQDTELPAIGHSKKQKLFNLELLLMYYCPFCGEEYDNKVNLHKHMQDDHMDENQSPEHVLRCPMCDAIFYHLDAYELHLTFHSTDDIYTEKSEMLATLTEFSLDTVPPTTEKVQTWEPQANAECSMNAVGIERFLELAMDESNQSSGETNQDNKVKSKKRKKHKKSKKAAITLDEFLSMNQDVFGEDLDFQGAEEVPTRLIAKQIKTKKKPNIFKTVKSVMNSADLQKLKKQGVLVKVKSGNDSKLKLPNKLGNIASDNILSTTNPKPVNSNVISLSTTNDVLSKLLNQSNNQIKIVKKPASDSISVPGEHKVQDLQNLSETTNKSSSLNNTIKEDEDETNFPENLNDTIRESNKLKNLKVTKCASSPKGNVINDMVLQKDNDESKDLEATKIIDYNEDNNSNITPIEQKNSSSAKCHLNTLRNTLRNISQNITIKHVPQSTNVVNKQNTDNELSDHAEYTDEELQDRDIQGNDNTKKISVKNENKHSNESMTTLKQLSSQIKVTKFNNTGISDNFDRDDDKEPDDSDFDEHNTSPRSMEHEEIFKEGHLSNKPINTTDTLKILGNQITVKSMSPSIKSSHDINNTSRNKDDESDVNQYENANHLKVQNSNRRITINSMSIPRNINTKVSVKLSKSEKEFEPDGTEMEGMSKVPSSINLLKHLKYVTAKPVSTAKNSSQTEVKESSIQSPNVVKHNVMKKLVQNKEVNEEIEIFNIDDSDSETDNQSPTNTSSKCVRSQNVPVKSQDTLKNISKNITFKLMNPKSLPSVRNSTYEEQVQSDDDYEESNFSDNENDDQTYRKAAVHTKDITHKLLDQNKITFNTLKKLGKHITVKSRNSSPSLSHSSQDQNSQDSNDIPAKDDSDDDFCSGNVKITELGDDHESDTEMSQEMNKNNYTNSGDNNAVVQFPHDSNSDDDEQYSDIESQIKPNMLKKPNQQPTQSKQSVDINKLKNISKNITIKSLNERNSDNCGATSEPLVNTANASSTKPVVKRAQAGLQSDDGISNSKTNSKQISGQFLNQAKINQNITSSNQMNTINKEVRVKTFKTETVVQEITTTVTKTIRTINQQTCNAGQATSVRPQKIVQGPRKPQQCKNYKGVTVRQCAPSIRPNLIRPGIAVRHSNALVPVRPGLNIRPSTPRPSIVNKILPSTSNQPNRPCQPLKVLPNTLNPPAKRPCPTNEPTTSFGGFKKPKDIMAEFDSDSDDAVVQYSSTSHMSKSNFTSTMKTVKGGSVVMSTKKKSEISASSQQQLNRLGNVSGLVVKSNQAMQVEKKSDVTAPMQTTLDAIEKLQKQGLLVKKPCVEESDWMSEDDEGDDGIPEGDE